MSAVPSPSQPNPQELELLVCGVPNVDIEDWMTNTTYRDCRPTDKLVKWFWEVRNALTGSTPTTTTDSSSHHFACTRLYGRSLLKSAAGCCSLLLAPRVCLHKALWGSRYQHCPL